MKSCARWRATEPCPLPHLCAHLVAALQRAAGVRAPEAGKGGGRLGRHLHRRLALSGHRQAGGLQRQRHLRGPSGQCRAGQVEGAGWVQLGMLALLNITPSHQVQPAPRASSTSSLPTACQPRPQPTWQRTSGIMRPNWRITTPVTSTSSAGRQEQLRYQARSGVVGSEQALCCVCLRTCLKTKPPAAAAPSQCPLLISSCNSHLQPGPCPPARP